MEEDEGKVQPLGDSRPYLGGLSFFAAPLKSAINTAVSTLKYLTGRSRFMFAENSSQRVILGYFALILLLSVFKKFKVY